MVAELAVVTETLPKSQVGMTIEVPAELVDATYERVLNRLASRAKIEGFRPGRAPRQLIEARIGPAALREEVVEAIVPEVLQQAMRDESIDPIDNPDVEVLELERGRPARLKATITVMPQVTLGDVSKLTPQDTPAVEVTDQMVERRLDDVREPLAEVTPVERELRTGDLAVIDVEVEADGQVVESESRKAMEAELKEGVLLPELLAALPGTFVDEQREVTVKFPDDYSEPKLAGKDGTIRVTVRGVKEKVLPELNDELAKQLSGGKQETVEAFRGAVRRYFDYVGKTVPQWVADERPDAEARLKVDLVLDEFAKQEGIAPSDEEVEKYIEEQAVKDEELSGRIPEVKKSPTARRYFESRLRRLKVLVRLAELASVPNLP